MIVLQPKDIKKLRGLLRIYHQIQEQESGIERVEFAASKVAAGKVRYLSNRCVLAFLRKFCAAQHLVEDDLPVSENDSIADAFKVIFGIVPDMHENRFVVLQGDLSLFLAKEEDYQIISSDVPDALVVQNYSGTVELHWLDVTDWGDDTVHISTQVFSDVDLEKLGESPPITYVLKQCLSPRAVQAR